MGIQKFPIYLLTIIIGLLFFPTTPIQPSTEPFKQKERQKRVYQDDINKAADYLPYIQQYTNGQKVSLPLIMAVMKTESNFDPNAISRKGALGLMQLMPITAMEEYNRFGYQASEPVLRKNLLTQPELNLLLGIGYIKTLNKQLSGIVSSRDRQILVLAAYNAGLKRVKRAFGCSGTQCLIWRVNNSGIRFFKRSLRRLPLETRSYLLIVDKAHRYYSQVFYTGEVENTSINQI